MLKSVAILIVALFCTCTKLLGQVDPDSTNYRVFYATAFTPNNDGHNETFYPAGNFIKSYRLIVYTRTSTLIFNGEENQPWDGWNKGSKVPDGVYLVIMYVVDGFGGEHVYKTNLTLLGQGG